MMIGSILLNFWAALGTFTIYFLFTFQKPGSPFTILLGAFFAAIAGFVIMFLLRYLIGYILYTPEKSIKENDTIMDHKNTHDHEKMTTASNSNEIDSEEIAQVVRTMMSSE